MKFSSNFNIIMRKKKKKRRRRRRRRRRNLGLVAHVYNSSYLGGGTQAKSSSNSHLNQWLAWWCMPVIPAM
jgi:hypothetical protein